MPPHRSVLTLLALSLPILTTLGRPPGPFMAHASPVQVAQIAKPRSSPSTPSALPLTVNGTLSDTSPILNDGSYYQEHRFEGTEGQAIAIEMSSQTFDTYLILLDGEGNRLAVNDDGLGGTDSQIIIQLPRTGSYRIWANAFSPGATGTYQLQVRAASDADITLAEAVQLNQQVAQLYQQSRFEQAIPLAERSLQLQEQVLGEDHPDLGHSLNNLAELYREQGDYTEAEPLYQRSLQIWQQNLGDDHPLVAVSLNNLAILYQSQGRYGEAEPLYQRSLRIQEDTLGNDHPELVKTLNNLAELYREQGRYTEAEPLYRRSLRIAEQSLGETDALVASVLNNLARLKHDQGHYAEAEPLYQRALSIAEQAFGEAHPLISSILGNLADLFHDQGRYGEAEPLYQRSLQIAEQTLGNTHPNVASILNNLAGLYESQGEVVEAERLYQRSLGIAEQALGDTHPDVATTLNNLAELYRDQGNFEAAEPLYQRSLGLLEQTLGEAHPTVAVGLNNLALLYRQQGRGSEAEALYQRSLSIAEQTLGVTHPDVANTLVNLAALYQGQRRYTEAIPLYQRALAIEEQTWGPMHPDLASTLNNLAVLYQQQNNFDEAASLYRRSLSIAEQALGDTHPFVATPLSNLAALAQEQGQYDQALALLQRTLGLQETTLTDLLSIGSETRKLAFLTTLQSTTDWAVSFHLQATPTDAAAAEMALTTLLRRKGRVLDSVADTVQRLRHHLEPAEQALVADLQTLQSQLAALVYGGVGDRTPADYQAAMTQLRSQIETLENTLAQRSAAFRVETQPVTVEAIADQLPTDAVLVEWVKYQPFDANTEGYGWGEPRYAAYLLDPEGRIQWVDLGDAATIEAQVAQFREAMRRQNFRIATIARQLDAQIMAPIRDRVGSARHLLLSPDGQLHLIPFAALVDESDRYLVETYTLTYLSAGRDLLRLQLDAPPRQGAVLLANPSYDTPGSPDPIQIARLGPEPGGDRGSSPGTGGNRRSTDLSTLVFGSLPGTAQEADAILPLLPDGTLLTAAQATETALKRLHGPRILHIATHGFFFPPVALGPSEQDLAQPWMAVSGAEGREGEGDRPTQTENPLLRSGLALAGFNARESGPDDGVLTALEASGLDLQGTQLVVLSACDTGLGDVVNGEGVYGLRRALVIAGAESQLMSLWKVDDYATSDLMTRYYQQLQGGAARSEALRQVQLEMLQQPDYQHPYFWAAFIFSGDWRSLEQPPVGRAQ